MREREEEIRNINKGMVQVNEIYKDLAHIVGSQQEHVDAIESQMEESRQGPKATTTTTTTRIRGSEAYCYSLLDDYCCGKGRDC